MLAFRTHEWTSRSVGVAVAALTIFTAARANAHFVLKQPAASLVQSSVGDPQKTGPCGGAGTPTGVVTAYKPGDTVTIQIDETIYHPGHYRVALAVNDPSELPAEPPVTPGTSECGSTVIQSPATFPILADGQLLHSQSFSGPQTFQVTLPKDVTCKKCTLQVLEFMSSHDAPCFYHHCANIAITTDGDAGVPPGTGPDASTPAPGGTGGTNDAGSKGASSATSELPTHDDSGCSAAAGGQNKSAALGIAATLLGLATWRRRSRRQ